MSTVVPKKLRGISMSQQDALATIYEEGAVHPESIHPLTVAALKRRGFIAVSDEWVELSTFAKMEWAGFRIAEGPW